MEILQRTKADFSFIDLSGEIASLYDGVNFKAILEDLVESGRTRIAVNFEKAKNLSSDFINAILSAHHALRKKGGEIVLIGHNLRISETLNLVGIPMIMSVYVDEKSFDDAQAEKK